MGKFNITLDQNWWNNGIWVKDSFKEDEERRINHQNLIERQQELINLYSRVNNLVTVDSEKYNQTCQEYENTIQELEEIIGTQQRNFLDTIDNLEMEVQRNHIQIDELHQTIEDLESEINIFYEE